MACLCHSWWSVTIPELMLMRWSRWSQLCLENQPPENRTVALSGGGGSQGGEPGLERRSSHGLRMQQITALWWCLARSSGRRSSGEPPTPMMTHWASRAVTQALLVWDPPKLCPKCLFIWLVLMCVLYDKMVILSQALFWPLCTVLGNY